MTGLLTSNPVKGTPVTLTKSTNAKFPDKTISELQYTFKVIRDDYDEPEIHYSIDEFRTDPYPRSLDFWVDDVLVYSWTISGDKSGIITTDELRSAGIHTIKIRINSGSYGDGCYKLNYLKLDNIEITQSGLDKLAYILYHSTITWTSYVNSYEDELEDYGFTVTKYKDPTNVISILNDIDDDETAESIVFILVISHGYYSSATGYSYISFPSTSCSSWTFYNEVEDFENKRTLVMIDACRSGDFVDKMRYLDGVSIITSADESHDSYYSFFPRYSLFSQKFFKTYLGSTENDGGSTIYYDDYYTFVKTKAAFSWCYGKYETGAWHSFFGP